MKQLKVTFCGCLHLHQSHLLGCTEKIRKSSIYADILKLYHSTIYSTLSLFSMPLSLFIFAMSTVCPFLFNSLQLLLHFVPTIDVENGFLQITDTHHV